MSPIVKTLRVASAGAVLALLAACGGPIYPSFGQTAYRIEGTAVPAAGGAPVQTVIYRDGPKMRVETTLPGQPPTAIVFDDATNGAYVLTAAAPVVTQPVAGAAPATTTTTTTTAPAPTPAAASTTTTTPAPSTAPAPAAVPMQTGVAVRVADADAPTPLEAPLAALGAKGAKSMGECAAAGERGTRWTPKEKTDGVERVACISDDGVVLEILEGQRVLFQATKLTRGTQDPALFGIPAGYQIIDPERVVKQVGAALDPLASVTGAQPAPTVAAPASAPAPAPAPAPAAKP
jgi:ribonuclease E